MKYALIGDVHANLPALEAVLVDAEHKGVDQVWNVGDWVGYSAFPDQVVQRLRDEKAVSIVGNYDLNVLKFPESDQHWRKHKRPEKWLAFKWAYEHLSETSRGYLASLPHQVRLNVRGTRVLLTHGSPAFIDEHLYVDTPSERLRELAELAQVDIIVCGHTHQPFVRRVDGVWFINTGSVGRQDDGDPRATYAVLEIVDGFSKVRHYRIDYDVERAVAAIRQHGLPLAFAEMVRQGRKLVWVLEQGTSGAS